MKNVPSCVLTLGTFDGVHRGHQRLLAVARRRADALGIEVCAVVFERPPRLFFNPLSTPSLLTTPSEKGLLLRRYGADRVESLIFSKELASLSVEEFTRRFLIQKWHVREMVVGFNFRFGRDRLGDVESLGALGQKNGFRVHSVGPVRSQGGVVSSGRVRSLVSEGQVALAHRLMGHPYPLEGTVVGGRGVGRRLGYPTANLAVSPEKIWPRGVFVARAFLPTGIERRALVNIGRRPTFQGSHPTVEAHLLDFSGDLTGRLLRLELIEKLREEKKFSTPKALVRQIACDESFARGLSL